MTMNNEVAMLDIKDAIENSLSDLAISRAKRLAAYERIRDIRKQGQERIDQQFADHLADHGTETKTSAEDFLLETA